MAKVKKKSKKISSWLENKTIARYGTSLGVVLIILLIILSLFLSKNKFQLAKERLARNSNDFEAHLILAEEYLKNNQLSEAEKELLLAQQIQPLNYQINWLWQKKMELKPEEIKQLIAYWEKIISEKSDYRDGYLQLALLHYKLYENEKAQEYLQKAHELDPNFEPARELEKILRTSSTSEK